MLLWLCGYIFSIFLCLVVTFRPDFHSDYLAPSATIPRQRSTTHSIFSLINTMNCIPPPSAATGGGSPLLYRAVQLSNQRSPPPPPSSYVTIQRATRVWCPRHFLLSIYPIFLRTFINLCYAFSVK